MDLRLGESDNLVNYSQEQITNSQTSMWKLVVDGVFTGFIGLQLGLISSIFFKKKIRVIGYSTGLGIGYSLGINAPIKRPSIDQLSFKTKTS